MAKQVHGVRGVEEGSRMASPMPDDPPVINTVFPEMSICGPPLNFRGNVHLFAASQRLAAWSAVHGSEYRRE
jgi:hypothetical protein